MQDNSVPENASEVITEVSLFPNPVSDGEFYLNLPDNTVFPVVMQIYSMTGNKVMQMELKDCRNTIKTESLINGLYVISLNCNGTVQKLKLQISR